MSLSGQIALFDIGNTKTALSAANKKTMGRRAVLPTTEVLKKASLKKWLAQAKLKVGAAVICSVVPKAADALEKIWREEFSTPFLRVGRDIKVPLKLALKNPHTAGQDRLVCAWEAWRRHGACLIVDAGTAITIDAVDADGTFLGGVIAPGMKLGASALHAHTAQLPELEIKLPKRAIGNETRAAMLSGVVFGTAEMVAGLLTRMQKERGKKTPVLLTGGDAPLLAKIFPKLGRVETDLLFNGLLNLWYEHEQA
jgi:type III pantothenate kinase